MIVDEIVNLNGTYVGPVSDINVRNVDNVTVVALDPLRWGTVEMTLYKIVGGREIEIGNPKLNATTTYQDNLSVSSAEFLRLKVTTADTSVDSAQVKVFGKQVFTNTGSIPRNFILEAAAGRVPGYSSERKIGRNIDIDTASVPEDIWGGGGLYTGFPTSGSAETVDVFSSSANDTSAGTGARTIRMFGLDADYNEQFEDITLNGTTAVTSTKTWWRLNHASVTSVGSGATNAGEITIRHTTTTANVFAVMPAQKGQTSILAYTIPNGKQGLFSQFQLVVEHGSGSGTEVGFEFKIRDNGGAGVERAILYGLATRTSPFVEQSPFTEPISPKTDIWVTITSVSHNNTVVSGEVQYMLVPA